jgi:hypothetical protein
MFTCIVLNQTAKNFPLVYFQNRISQATQNISKTELKCFARNYDILENNTELDATIQLQHKEL